MSKVAGERYVYKFIDIEAICQFNPELTNFTSSESRGNTNKANISTPLFKSRSSKLVKLASSHRYQPYKSIYSAGSTNPLPPQPVVPATTTTTTTTTVVHHPITINQLNYEINNTNNFLLNDPTGLSVTTTTNYDQKESTNNDCNGYSNATNSAYYQTVFDSPRSAAVVAANLLSDMSTSTPAYYKYQTPVNNFIIINRLIQVIININYFRLLTIIITVITVIRRISMRITTASRLRILARTIRPITRRASTRHHQRRLLEVNQVRIRPIHTRIKQ